MRPPRRKFTKVSKDGSFVVRVSFASSPGEPIEHVRDWLSEWIKHHSDWQEFGASRPFAAYFSAPPQVELGSAGELNLLLHGLSDEGEKRFWKEWYVRICHELLTRFPVAGKVARAESVEAT